ncbi:MAG: hypothetical protein IID36_06645 [Planctomycetes bacterium]|nr:hypothetical protein [Planctomycetota bacterium]
MGETRTLSPKEMIVEVFIDDNKVEDPQVEAATLEETVRSLQTQRCSPGRLIVGMRCDGIDLTGEEMAAALAKPADSCDRLEVFTGTHCELVGDATTQAIAALDRTNEARTQIADQFSAGQQVEAIERLAECIRTWQQIHAAIINSVRILNLDSGGPIEIGGRPLEAALVQPRDMLLQIKQALQASDHVLLADILQYECDGAIDQWRTVLAEIQRIARDLDTAESNAT